MAVSDIPGQMQAEPSPLPIALGRTAFEGAFHTGTSQAVRAFLTLATTVLVARLLVPDDFGVIAMATPVLAFVLLFQDLGLSAVTIQAPTIDDEQCSTLFWVTVGASAAIALLLLFVSPLVSWFYQDVRVGYVTAASAINVLVTGAVLQHMALLTRELRFKAIARVVVIGALTNFVATVALTLWLRSYWAIFLGNLAGICVQGAATWTIQRWRPSRQASLKRTGSMLRLGSSVAGFDLLNFFSRNTDDILIGRSWGAGALGLYERSYSLMMAPLQLIRAPVARVMLPLMSRLVDKPTQYRLAYLSSLRAVLLVTAPAAAVAAATSEELIPLLLGDHWSEAAPIFFWLALGSFYLPVASSTGILFISTARGRSLMLWGLFSSVTTVIAFAIGLPWGPVGVAKAYLSVTLAQTIIVIPWASRGTAVKSVDFAILILPFLLAASGTWLFVRALHETMSVFLLLAASLPLAYLATTLLVGLFPEGRTFLVSTIKLLKWMMSREKGGAFAADGDG